MSKVKELYYAVNGNGQGVIFCTMPERNQKRKIWMGEIVSIYIRLVMQLESENLISLPSKMRWVDNPVKLNLNLDICLEELG